MKTNKNQLIKHAAIGEIAHPNISKSYWIGYDGKARSLPSVGSISYNIKIGDKCLNLVGDHIEPGVSIKNSDPKFNLTLNTLACVGNEVTLISGNQKNKKGIVVGKHGGVDHVMVLFEDDVVEDLIIGDKMQVKTYGLGLSLLDYPEITVMNLDPNLLEKLDIIEENNQLTIKVAKVIPPYLMGAGIGSDTSYSGDYDLMLFDQESIKENNLEDLRFGDFVAIVDHYAKNGPHYKKGALTIGLIVHGDSYSAGHGPGVMVLFTTKDKSLNYILDKEANLINYVK